MDTERVSLPPIQSMLDGPSISSNKPKEAVVLDTIKQSSLSPSPPPPSPSTMTKESIPQRRRHMQHQRQSSSPVFSVDRPPLTHITHSMTQDNHRPARPPAAVARHHYHHHRRAYSTESFLDHTSTHMYKKQPVNTAVMESHDQQQQNHRYRCPMCPKTFSRPSSLRVHIYSHTGEKPHECPHPGCGRRFSVQSNMRRHLRVHYCSSFSDDQQQTQDPQVEIALQPKGGAAVDPIPSLIPSSDP